MNVIQGGELVKFCRLARKYTQQDAARHYGVTTKTLSNWEKGRTKIAFDDVIGLMQLYKMDMAAAWELLKNAEYKAA